MCLALPARVVALNPDGTATVTLGGVKKAISVELLDRVAEGDYVVVHTGFAISRLDPVDAENTLAIWRGEGSR
jgi:hydrogenase expression/formation protein HypC